VADDDRLQRLRAALLLVAPDTLRKSVRRVTEEVVRSMPGPARPLMNQLRKTKDPLVLLRRVPNLHVVMAIADQVADEPLEVCRAVLGDAADEPTKEQLLESLAKTLELFDVAEVRVMLATVALADASASDMCDELLREDERFVAAQSAPNDGGSSE
jgi:hypothetical protein